MALGNLMAELGLRASENLDNKQIESVLALLETYQSTGLEDIPVPELLEFVNGRSNQNIETDQLEAVNLIIFALLARAFKNNNFASVNSLTEFKELVSDPQYNYIRSLTVGEFVSILKPDLPQIGTHITTDVKEVQIEFDEDFPIIIVNGEAYKVSAHAYNLMKILNDRPGKLVSYDDIYGPLLDVTYSESNNNHKQIIASTVTLLRRILGEQVLITERAKGLRFLPAGQVES